MLVDLRLHGEHTVAEETIDTVLDPTPIFNMVIMILMRMMMILMMMIVKMLKTSL